jgi:hypothetical protein
VSKGCYLCHRRLVATSFQQTPERNRQKSCFKIESLANPSIVRSCQTKCSAEMRELVSYLLYRVYHMSESNFVNTRISAILGLIELCLSSFESSIAALHLITKTLNQNRPITGVQCKISGLLKNAHAQKGF